MKKCFQDIFCFTFITANVDEIKESLFLKLRDTHKLNVLQMFISGTFASEYRKIVKIFLV